MHATDTLTAKVEILKKIELFAYQAAYFLLQDEELAIQATCDALLQIAKEDHFFIQSSAVQREVMKQAIVKHAITVKQKAHYTLDYG